MKTHIGNIQILPPSKKKIQNKQPAKIIIANIRNLNEEEKVLPKEAASSSDE